MERLTIRTSEIHVAYTQGKYKDTIPAEMTKEDIRNVLNKLAHYEDLEEQGLLLKLPCAEGDTVYVIGTKCLANVVFDEECDMHECDTCPYDVEKVVFETKATIHLILVFLLGDDPNWTWNKTVFKTKAEAEKVLEEMEK